MLKIGLTGGIACGKSAASEVFVQLGASICDADIISRALTQPGTDCFQAIVEHFGQAVLKNGQLNRQWLAKTIFSHPKAKHWLEQLLHPRVRQHIHQHCQNTATPYTIIVIPLLTQCLDHYPLDRICVVDLSEAIQWQRLTKRSSYPITLLKKIVAQQPSRIQYQAIADDILNNEQSPTHLRAQVHDLHERYLKMAQATD